SEHRVVLARVALVGDEHVDQTVGPTVDVLGVDHESRELVIEDLRLQPGARPGACDVPQLELEIVVGPGPCVHGETGGSAPRPPGEKQPPGEPPKEPATRGTPRTAL